MENDLRLFLDSPGLDAVDLIITVVGRGPGIQRSTEIKNEAAENRFALFVGVAQEERPLGDDKQWAHRASDQGTVALLPE